MKWSILWFVVSVVLSLNCVSGQAPCVNECQINNVTQCATCCMRCIDTIFKNGNLDEIIEAVKSREVVLEEDKVNGIEALQFGNFAPYLLKPDGTFEGLSVYASDQEASEVPLHSSTVSVELPGGLDAGQNITIVFCMLKWPETNPENKIPSCQFLNFLTNNFFLGGFIIQWTPGQNNVICCLLPGEYPAGEFATTTGLPFIDLMLDTFPDDVPDAFPDDVPDAFPDDVPDAFPDALPDITQHLAPYNSSDGSPDVSPHNSSNGSTYYSAGSRSSADQKILTYISLIGCSLSLFALVITVLLFITNRKLREDVSMKVHISLVIAMILLNLHFLLSQAVAAKSSMGLCLYMALVLHYSLLATFSWMALEGFNLYLLVVKVFDIYVSRYLLKLSVVGWGVPAVIVSVVVIINRRFYGQVSHADGSAICYITNGKVKMVTNLGLFSMVFLFNMIMFAVTVKRVFSVGHRNKIDRKKVGQHICRLLGVGALLGITWGLVFFSFGHLSTPGFYVFCILNSLQGVFIFLWFVMSLRKAKNSPPKTSSDTRNTSN